MIIFYRKETMKHFTKDEFEQLTYVKSGTFGSVFHDGKIAFKKYHHEIKAIGYVLIKNPCLKQNRHKFKRMWKRQSKIEYTDLICDTFSIDNDYSGVCYPYYQGQLLEEIRKESSFKEKEYIALQLIRNAKELTDQKIYPLDYKLNNVIYTSQGQVKIIDLDDQLTKVTLIKNPYYFYKSTRRLKSTLFHFFEYHHYYLNDELLQYLECYHTLTEIYSKKQNPYKNLENEIAWRSIERTFLLIDMKDLSKDKILFIHQLLETHSLKVVLILPEFLIEDNHFYKGILDAMISFKIPIFDVLLTNQKDKDIYSFINSYYTLGFYYFNENSLNYISINPCKNKTKTKK